MSKTPAIKPGSIVWAHICDRSGRNPKERPLLVIPPAPNGPGAILCCLAISTDPAEDPTDPAVELPWDANNGSTTGLFQRSRVVLLWHVPLDQSQVTYHSGLVTRAILDGVLAAREIAISFRAKPGR